MNRSPGHYRRRTWGLHLPEDDADRSVRDLGPPRYCKRCGCKLNSYNQSTKCLPCQRYVIVNPLEEP